MEHANSPKERHVRTLFVSDVHLGCRFAQTEKFLEYINRLRPEQLYILGDFLDGWKLRSGFHWTPTCSRILERIFQLAHRGTEIYYAPGNHDDFLRNPGVLRFLEHSGLDVTIRDEFIIKTLDGRRFLAIHGDKFDRFEQRHQWLSLALSYVYDPILFVNWLADRLVGRFVRNVEQSPYWAAARLKKYVKSLARFFSSFEQRLASYVRDRQCHGVICGHIHTPGVTSLGDTLYVNVGDWVENCTALVELEDGEFVLESFYADDEPQSVTRPTHIASPKSAPTAEEHLLSDAVTEGVK